MTTELEDLWIMKEFGHVIFSKSEHCKHIKQDLLGSLLIVAYHASERKLQWFSIKKHQFFFIKKNKILFVFQYKLRPDRSAELQVSEFLISKFFELFPKEYIDKYEHKVSKFGNFKGFVKTKKERLGHFIDKIYNLALPTL